MIWLEEYHINKYVKKYDARVEGRYLNPPKIRSEFQAGDRVIILPQGRYKWGVDYKIIGRIADIIQIFDDETAHKISGRYCELKFLNGKVNPSYIREINLKKRIDKSEKHGNE